MKVKRKTKQRVCAAVIITVMAAMAFTGCSSSGTSSTSGSTSASDVSWEYVTPDDLTGDTAKASDQDSSKDSSSDQDSDKSGSSDQGQPPEKPDGSSDSSKDSSSDSSSDSDKAPQGDPPSGDKPSGEPPEKPDGDSGSAPSGDKPDGQPPELPDGDSGSAPGGAPGGANTASYDYSGDMSGAVTADGEEKTSDGETIEATDKDQNALLAKDGGTLEVTNATITKTGSDEDGDNCNFYGLNSSALAVGEGSSLYLSDSSISSDSAGSNGIFATDSATAYANNVTITTTDEGNSRGLDATYGGVIYANDTTISTAKDHCAAVATDRGGGYISVTNSTLSTAGSGSPLLYSTGDLEVDNVTGTSSGSQIAGIEGMNRIVVNNSTLESTNDAISGSDPIKNGVILYQSTSGDADTASTDSSEFEAVDSTLKTNISDGAMFYVTNTTAKIVLENTSLDFDSDTVQLLNASGNDSNNWGTSGKNGGSVTLTGINQTMNGEISTDEISSADVYLTEGSSWAGSVTGDGEVTVNIDATSTWTVTEDCTVSDLHIADGGKLVDADGKTVTVKSGDEVLIQGESEITVTVSGTCDTSYELPESAQLNTKVLARDTFDEHYSTSTAFGTNKE